MINVRTKEYFLLFLLGSLTISYPLLVKPILAMQQDSQWNTPLTGALVLDLYTNRGGGGANMSGGSFYPGEKIILYANVTYEGDYVANVFVSYEVINPLGQDMVFSTAISNSQGTAEINFTIPSAPIDAIYGTWTAIATTSVAQIFASDRATFQVVHQQTSIAGDVNGDGKVDISDATLVIMWWGQLSPPAPASVDINHDGIVGISDAAIIGANWLKHI